MLRITRRADYALRLLLELSAAAPGGRTAARRLALRAGVPLPFLHKVGADLRRAGLLHAQPGTGGGLALAVPPHRITLRAVFEAVEGPVALSACLVRPDECPRAGHCPAHPALARVQAAVVGELEGITLQDMLDAAGAARLPASSRAPAPALAERPGVS